MKTVRRDALQRSDHIYTDCSWGLYYHHGIYVGKAKVTNPKNGEQREIYDAVIHLFGPTKDSSNAQCQQCFHLPQNAGVSITCLDCFLGGHSLYVYKYDVSYWKLRLKRSGTCSVWSSKPADEVIQIAFTLLEKNSFGNYNFLFNNCEDFATYCKTGQATSNQAAGVLFGFGLPGVVGYNALKELYFRN
ncbi:hypothetical protein QUC31_009712 [Theobroma cacao]|uniref:Uncharacterized protein LOC18600156 n=2 Tax=Theobroma cacao TaxID=3641 RepID=A0AB32V6M2_THECC|nr:PREDICTED: uncharacterized protein LOC18600156 [Theobroma cacao]EOY11030.1 NC domain-containing-related-like protein [Theobroma cacao]